MSNHLKNESSPYLLQHAENPVDWYPWGMEAFQKAEEERKPIFLSIGYSTCHWCHVMAQESFENEKIAEVLNQYFVSVKVDREERPDIDSVYMSVCQMLTGSGGWPMSIFMTAKQKPFFAGTYYPPTSRYGMTGFLELLLIIAEKWEKEGEKLAETAENIIEQIHDREDNGTGGAGEKINIGLPEKAIKELLGNFDAAYGGFGLAPKFPMPHNLLFLMLYAYLNEEELSYGYKPTDCGESAEVHLEERQKNESSGIDRDIRQQILWQVRMTLEQMRRGGIFDQIGYGFSRYSTDRIYLVPHFEKMLYDNALLIIAYAVAYRMIGDAVFLDTAEQTAEYILREMTGKQGEFYSAQDADSEGEEGKFYLWRPEEVCEVLGEEKGKQFCAYYGITKQGNFEGSSIPNLLNGNEITNRFEEERRALYQYRASRVSLHLDDKVLTAWNGLMICAMSMLYRITGKQSYLYAARRAEKFIRTYLMEDGILFVSWRNGIRTARGFLDEYAYMAAAYISLFEATAESVWLKRAKELCQGAQKQFGDEEGGFFLYGIQNSELIIRPKETYDGALPSGNSVMAYCLVRLSELLKEEDWSFVRRQLIFLSNKAAYDPSGHCMFLIALLYRLCPPQKITVVLAEPDSAEQIMLRMPLYADMTVMPRETVEYPLLNHKTTYYICRNHTCLPPTNVAPKEFISAMP